MTRALFLVPDRRSFARATAMAEMLAAGGWQVELAGPARPPMSDNVTYVPLDVPRGATTSPGATAGLGPWAAVPWQRFAPHHERLFALAVSRPWDVTIAFGVGSLGAGVAAAHLSGGRLVVDVDRVAAEDSAAISAYLGPLVHDLERWLVPYADAVTAASHALADLTALRAVVAAPDVVETRVATEPMHVAAASTSTPSRTRVSVLGPPGAAATFLRAVTRDDLVVARTAQDAAAAVALSDEQSDYWIPDAWVLNALEAGVAVVAPDSAGSAALVGRFDAGVLADSNPASLAAALDRLLTNDSLLERAREGARAAGEWLSPARQQQTLLSTCERVAAESPRLADPVALQAGRVRGEQLARNHPHLFGIPSDLGRYDRRELGREVWRRLGNLGRVRPDGSVALQVKSRIANHVRRG